ncbi:Gfo/Idh/MocA family oxidoreductase [Spirosoma taeanense]|uniref:Gfo/Idh/MocA family oxidoreductase n=1 Tax=Spirosoma taeanense TaxID=2735870 RepID=A0A6M5Y5M3_9BACT|nr:Gfo/Idh/MocA family oxidoreductase [Spirosoma taeanense]QJW88754.1 Gfo/Idh/MocA family oxidoreductase [Spirosoma taeanense]
MSFSHPPDRISVGLIGCGRWGGLILTELVALGAPVTVCDPDADRRQWAVANGAVAVSERFDTLGQNDGLIVATPASTHWSLLEQIADLGKPIFIEKPLTTSYADAQAIEQLRLPPTFVMHIWRYHAGIRLLGKLARTGAVGEVLQLKTTRTNWTSPRLDTDSLWTLAPHDLTIAQEILGHIPKPKAAAAEWHGRQIRTMIAMLGDRPQLIFEISTRYVDKRREVRLHGTEGVAVLSSETADYVELWRGNDQTPPDAIQYERLYFDATPPLRLELAAFLDYLKGGPAPVSDLAEGIEVVRILEELRALAN